MDNTQSKKELLGLLKKSKGYLVTCIVLLGFTILLAAFGVILKFRAMPDPIDYRDAEKLDEYVECVVEDVTDYFAEYTYDGKVESRYYFVLASNGLGIVEMGDKKYDEVLAAVENNEEITINGMTREMSYDLKKIAIESYNEMVEEEFLTYSNFEDYILPYVINTKVNPNSDSEVPTGFAFITGVIALLCGIVFVSQYFGSKSNLKKCEKEMDLNMVVEEMKQAKMNNKVTKTILTENYIISYSNRVVVLKIADIVWIYPHNTRTNGVKTNQNIYVMMKDRKTYAIADTAVNKKKTKEYEDTFNALINSKEKMLRGYTGENMTAVRKENFEETLRSLDIM